MLTAGLVCPAVAPLACAAGASVALHTASGGRTRIRVGMDHRGNVAIGPGHNTVEYQLKQQRKMQDRLSDTLQNTVKNPPTTVFLKRQKKSEYEIAKETIPNRIRLAKELQGLFKPVCEYNYANHKYRSSPWQQIYNAHHMKVDTSEYWNNRIYYSKLYKSMRSANIPHQDILAVWGNPYLGVLTEWSDLSYQRKQRLVQEYPGIDETAEKIRREREEFRRSLERMVNSPIDKFIDQMVIPMTTLALSNTPYGRAYAVAKTVVVPRLGQIATAMGVSELYRQYINFSKKHTSGGLKKGIESNAPRIQNTKGEADEYIKGLTDQKGWVLNRGKTKDGYHYYEVMKKFEYKGITFKRGQYISRDTKHHEIEWFRNKNEHLGAIDPVTGQLKPGKIDYSRRLKIK